MFLKGMRGDIVFGDPGLIGEPGQDGAPAPYGQKGQPRSRIRWTYCKNKDFMVCFNTKGLISLFEHRL